MKRHFYIIALASLAAFASCAEKDQTQTTTPVDPSMEVREVYATYPNSDFVQNTKSNLDGGQTFSWEEGDQLGFVPAQIEGLSEDLRKQVMFYINGLETGGKAARYSANGWGIIRDKQYFAYYPYSQSNTCTSVAVNYTGQTQTANGNSDHLGDFDYLHTWCTIAKDDETPEIDFRRIGCTARFTLTVPEGRKTSIFTKLTLTATESIFVEAGTYDPAREYTIVGKSNQAETVSLTPTATSKTFSLNLGNVTAPDGTLTLYAMMFPMAWGGKAVTLTLDGYEGSATNAFILTANLAPSKNQVAGTCYGFSRTMEETGPVDLSAREDANCYIVTHPGEYKFRADRTPVQHNSLTTPCKAFLNWETENTYPNPVRNSLISDVRYENGYVYFTVKEYDKKNKVGNALISLVTTQESEMEGSAIWSWHIWLLNDVPGDNDFGGGIVLMDRNLGAFNNTPGDNGAIGLLYQWGRPVPFSGARDYTPNGTNGAWIVYWGGASELPIRFPGLLNLSAADCIKWPLVMTFSPYGNGRWCDDTNPSIWWNVNKTQYDPCPPGYRIPSNFNGFTKVGNLLNTGAYVKGTNSTSYWFPITGMRGVSGVAGHPERISHLGHDAHYWSCAYSTNYGGSLYVGYGLNMNCDVGVTPGAASTMDAGNAVRCQKIN